MELAGVFHKERNEAQVSMFDLLNDIPSESSFDKLQLPQLNDWSDKDKLQCEKECLGFYVSGHPLDKFIVDSNSFSNVSSSSIARTRSNSPVRLLGVITKLSTKLDKRGNVMAFAQIEDFEGSIELIIFHETYDKFKSLLSPENIVWIEGNVSSGGDRKITVRKVTEIEPLRRRLAKYVDLTLPPESATDDNLKHLKAVLAKHKGNCRLRIFVSKNNLGNVKILTTKAISVEPSNELIAKIHNLQFRKMLTFAEN
jgi:DNA polymerase-3 subunit alpha